MKQIRHDLDTKRLILTINNRIIASINKKLFLQAQELLNEAKTFLTQVNDKAAKQKLESSLLNTEACLYHHKKNQDEALSLIDKAIQLEKQDFIGVARANLNKCAMLSDSKRHEEALILAKKANQILNGRKLLSPDRFGRQSSRQLYIISLLSIANQLQSLGRIQEAIQSYTKGLQACRIWIGQKHKLTTLMKNGISNLRKKCISQKSSYHQTFQQGSKNFRIRQGGFGRSVQNSVKKDRTFSLVNQKDKEKLQQIMGVYQPRFRAVTIKARRNVRAHIDEMQDLQKIKQLYKPHRTERYKTQVKQINDKSSVKQKSLRTKTMSELPI